MKRIIKILSAVILAIFLLIVLIPLAFKGKIKDAVLNEANKTLNARLDVGKISLSLLKSFPNVYVGLNDLRITGTAGFEQDTLLQVSSLSVTTGLSDLLSGSPYEIKKIKIDQADIRLKVLEYGLANWDIMKPADEGEEETGRQGEEGNFLLKLKSLVINDSRFVYDDSEADTYLELAGLNAGLKGDLTADRTILETHANISKTSLIYDGVAYLSHAVADWKGIIDANLTGNIYNFKDNQLIINNFPIVFEGSFGMPEEGYDLDLTFSTPQNSFKSLLSLVPAVYAKDFEKINTEGSIHFGGFVKGKYVDDQYPAFGINLKVTDAWFRYPDLPAPVDGIFIHAKISSAGGDLDNTVIDVSRMEMNLAGNSVNARLLLRNPMTDPYLDTRIQAGLNLANVEKFYPLEEGEKLDGQIAADITLKGRLSDLENERYNEFDASGTFNSSGIEYVTSYLAQELQIERAALTITPAFLDLSELSVKSGKSDFSLKGKLENYLAYYLKGEDIKGKFELKSSMIDVNELLTFPEEEIPAESDTTELTAFVVPPGVDFTLNVTALKVEYLGYKLNNLAGTVIVRDQKLILDGLSMDGLGGRLQMDGSYATIDPENPAVDFSLGVKNISIGEAFRQFVLVGKFAPIAEKVIGDISGDIKLAGLLDGNMMPRLESLTGLGDLLTTDLAVANVNTLNSLSNSLKMDQLKNLKIGGTKVFVEFAKGIMEVKPFDFKALGIDMNLGGQTTLNQQIGYVLKMKIPRSMMGGTANSLVNDLAARAGKAGADVQLGDYVNLDALIEGTVTDPKVTLNLAGMGKDLVKSLKDQAQQQVEQKVEEVKEQVKDEAEKILLEADQKAQALLDEANKKSDELIRNAQVLADEAKKQANANADRIVREAKGKGFVAEAAAKKSAEEVRKQGDKQAQNIMSEAQKQADSILSKANQEAGQIRAAAQEKVK